MAEATISCTFVTPGFLGGANQQRELRVPSLTGEMRYWLRALAAEVCGDDLRRIKLLEEAVFGSQRRAGIRVNLRPSGPLPPPRYNQVCPDNQTGFLYLAGQGLFMNGRMQRACIEPGYRFQIRLQGDPLLLDAAYASLLMLIRFGGIGARARRGFGAVAARDVGTVPRALSLDAEAEAAATRLVEDVQWALHQVNVLHENLQRKWEEDPSYSYLKVSPTTASPLYLCPGFHSYRLIVAELSPSPDPKAFGNPRWWLPAMSEVGRWLREFRADHKRKDGSYVTPDYHDVVAPFMGGRNISGAELQNDCFGLPVEYRSRSRDCKASLTWRKRQHDPSSQNRRASPLWVSFVAGADQDDWVVVTFLVFNSQFLPDGAEEILVPKAGCAGDDTQVVATGDTAYLADQLKVVPPTSAAVLYDSGWPRP